MPRIKLLAPHIISRTAAGEVVARPASVVKELIENSLDAGASLIKIHILNSGLDVIEVVDNGDGMDIEDVLISYKPHTTSKILDETDLNHISSFGFRGEALSSIASVSKLAIQSRIASHYVGHRVDLEGGDIIRSMPAGMPVGTIVEVKDLFFNTPARKKFLKSAPTEFRNILDVVVNAAMAFSHIGFTLINEDRIILDLPRYQTLPERTVALLGEPISSQLLPFVHEDAHFKVTGYISKPQISSTSRNHQYIFVNRRFVSNNIVSSAVKEAYGSLLEPRSHPALILFLELPYELVDVNVHPRKEEVSFYDDSLIYEFVKKAVQHALDSHDLTYTTDILGNNLENPKKALPYLFNHLKDNVDAWQVYATSKNPEIMQINNLYLVTQTKKGMEIIDQHAAHERILFEQFLAVYKQIADSGEKHVLPSPLVFDLSIQDTELLLENLEVLSKLGFDLEEFGINTFKLSSIPKVLSGANTLELINSILEDLHDGRRPSNINEKSIQTISYLSCRGAIKSGEYLNLQERADLLEKLSKTKSNYTCPHGRPVKVEVSMRELEKMFKRVK